MKLILLLTIAVATLAANSTVTDTVYDFAGNRGNGSIYITPNRQFTCADGHAVYPITIRRPVTNGAFTASLCPNDTATPSGTFYFARYAINGGQNTNEYWVVPTSGSVLTFTSVRSSNVPSTAVPISLPQIGQGTATVGQVPVWNGSSWIPGVGGLPCAFTAQTSVTCTHGLLSATIGVDVYDASGYTIIPARVQRTSTSVVVVTFDSATTGTIVVK